MAMLTIVAILCSDR